MANSSNTLLTTTPSTAVEKFEHIVREAEFQPYFMDVPYIGRILQKGEKTQNLENFTDLSVLGVSVGWKP